MEANLSEKQERALRFIRRYAEEYDRPPTLREVGAAIGVSSTNGVRYILEVLVRKGYLSRSPALSRGISLTQRSLRGGKGTRSIPLIGRIAAGSPLLAEENYEGHVAADAALVGSGETFALRVRGESMKDAGILDGDILFARPQSTAQKGDIVVALLDGEATVKYFRPEKGRIRLAPANRRFAPIDVPKGGSDFRILGKVIGLMRKM
jgi:repressor LexA